MSRPIPYNRVANFTSYALSNPTSQYNPADHDAEFNAVELTLDQVVAALNGITRDDGKLANRSVSIDTLSPDVFLALTYINGGWQIRGDWLTNTIYKVGDLVKNGTTTYVCTTLHVSGPDFNADLLDGYWLAINQKIPNDDGLLPLGSGGTGSDLSGTGGPGHYLKQSEVGGPITVETILGSDIVGPISGTAASVKKYTAIVDFGSLPHLNAVATVSNEDAIAGDQVIASINKKINDELGDELEMDGFTVAASCEVDGAIKFFAHCVSGYAAGEYEINYLIQK